MRSCFFIHKEKNTKIFTTKNRTKKEEDSLWFILQQILIPNKISKFCQCFFAGSCLLTDVVDQLHEDSKKINVVDRLSKHLDKGTLASAAASYLQQVRNWVPADPVIHIDDSDVVKQDVPET